MPLDLEKLTSPDAPAATLTPARTFAATLGAFVARRGLDENRAAELFQLRKAKS